MFHLFLFKWCLECLSEVSCQKLENIIACFGICVFVPRYSIDRNTDLERFFNVDALSGVISTAKPLDREANSVHNLTIFAIESRKFPYSMSQSKPLINAPFDLKPSNLTLAAITRDNRPVNLLILTQSEVSLAPETNFYWKKIKSSALLYRTKKQQHRSRSL